MAGGNNAKQSRGASLEISAQKLQAMIIAADDRLIAEGAYPFQRPLKACKLIADELGIAFTLGGRKDPFVEAVHQIYGQLYRPEDLYSPALFVGAFMFRDMFIQLRVPLAYGAPVVNPIDSLVGLSDLQKRWLFSDKTTGLTYFDQCFDLWDFAYSLDDVRALKKQPAKAIEWWSLARQQLEAAAATVLISFDQYVVIQNCIIAAELFMKGALFAAGYEEKRIVSFQHRLSELAEEVTQAYPHLETERFKSTIRKYPGLIERRYEFKEYKRTEIGALLMGTQYVAGEIMRLFTERNMRKGMQGDKEWDVSKRTFPPI